VDLRLAGLALDDDGLRALDPPLALEERDLVLLEEVALDALAEPRDDPVLAAHRGGEVDPHVVGDDAVLLAVLDVLVEVGRVQERLRGDAAPQQAGAAGADGISLDDRRLEAHLRRSYRRHVAAGARPDHRDVEDLAVRQAPLPPYFTALAVRGRKSTLPERVGPDKARRGPSARMGL